MTVGTILAFLISNGPSIISAGVEVASIVTAFFDQFQGRDEDDPLTEDEFNAFIDRALGNRAELETLIAQARAEMGGA